jgi:hypothetical protein
MTLGSFQAARLGTIGVASGKWYWEIVYTAATAFDGMVGVADQSHNLNNYVGSSSVSWGYYYTGVKYNAASATSYGSSWTTGDVMSIALDMDNLAIYFAKNGVWQNSGVPTSGASKTGAAYTNLSGTIFPALNAYGGTQVANWGARPFAYTAPSGFKALCTANLPAPVVTKPSEYMDVVLYTGNGSTQTISGLGFSPDLVWIKSRNDTYAHRLLDTVRGATKILYSNGTDAEDTDASSLTAFDSNGFTLGSTAGINGSSVSFAAWAWDAGTTTVTNTQGSITSQVRANASAGFSIIGWTGTGVNASIGHGLGVAPKMVITKSRTDSGTPWVVDLIGVLPTSPSYLLLNSTQAANAGGSTATSSVVNILEFNDRNGNGKAMIMYAFASVAGYSAFGSYTGNGSADGPFQWCGFRPRWLMIKCASGSTEGNWIIYDALRGSYNLNSKKLAANLSSAENDASYLGDDTVGIDFLSNGFKIRVAGINHNISSGTYVYAAFAESPFAANNRAR